MREIKFGFFMPTGDFNKAKAAALWADTHGFYSVSINDHFFSPLGSPQTPQLECFTTLSAIAAITKNVRLAPAMTAMSFRHPPMLAKMASTLDQISNGRLVLGLGSGWQRSEYDAHGYPYPSNLERIDQLADAVKLIKTMWTQEEPTYHGRYFSVDKAYNHPRPVQQPHPPIMIGGSGKKMLELVAAEAQIASLAPPIINGKDMIQDPAAAVKFDKADLKRRIAMLHRFAEAAGRDPQSIEIGGIAMVNVVRDKSQANAAAKAIASAMGFPDEDGARNAPTLLIGTPDQVRRELRSRIDDFGMTYYIVFPASAGARDLFVSEVMPEFVN
jgi:probable F420-dependent oxidoreductase